MSRLPPATQPAATASEPRFRWVMLALVWLLYVSFGMTAFSLAPLVKTISRDLGISSSMMGLVLGAWQLMYILVAYFMGTLVDRLGPRRALLLGAVLVTASLALRATAVDFFSLLAIVALFGVGGSVISIGAPKVVAVWFVGHQRGVAVGMYMTAPMVGGIAVLAATNSLVVPLTGHWRYAFLTYGAVAALTTIVWWLMARDRRPDGVSGRDSPPVAATAVAQVPATFRSLLRYRNVRLVLLLSFAAFLLGHGLNNWLPTVLTDKGMTPARAGLWASIPSLIGIFAVLLIPWLARHGYRSFVLAALLLAGAASTLAIGLFSGGLLAGALVVSGISRWPLMPLLTLVLMETRGVGARSMGAAAGMFFAVAEAGGFFGPFLLGLLRDLTGTLLSGLVLLTIVAAALSVFALLIQEHREAR